MKKYDLSFLNSSGIQNNNRFLFILCSLFIFFVFLSSCQNKSREQNRDDGADKYKQLVEKKINELQNNNLNRIISNQSVYFGLDSLNRTDLKQILPNCLFFFYFSHQTCAPCLQQTVECIREVFPDYENDNRIIFISPDYPARFKRNCYGKKLLTLSNSKLGIPLETENVPFIFTLNDKLVIEKLHIVDKNDFDKTLFFLKTFDENNH